MTDQKFVRFGTTRKNAYDELRRENLMRRKVYKIDSSQCTDQNKLKQYQVTTDLEAILKIMTDTEFNGFMQRVEAERNPNHLLLF
jgi:hypothetical protein